MLGKKKEETPVPEKPKDVFQVLCTRNFIVMSGPVVIEITRGGHAKNLGVKLEVGASFKDVRETKITRKLTALKNKNNKSSHAAINKQIQQEIARQRKDLLKIYKNEALEKLKEIQTEKSVVEAVEKELRTEHLEYLLR